MRQLAYGTSGDQMDEYLQIGETTANTTLRKFFGGVVACFKSEFLQPPNPDELKQIMAEYEDRGFPGCKGSLDGMHWEWKNCPAGWAGQFQGKEKTPTIVLEGVASKNLRFWHAYVGAPGALNDINVLNRSHLFSQISDGTFTSCFSGLQDIYLKFSQAPKTWSSSKLMETLIHKRITLQTGYTPTGLS